MKVAIYSGAIPSTTFVEHLINGLGANGVEVLLFGKYIKKYSPSHLNIKVYASPANKFSNAVFVIKNLITLLISDYKTFKMLPEIIKVCKIQSRADKLLFLSRILPMLIHKPDIFHIQWAKTLQKFFWIKTLINAKVVVSLRGGQINYSPVADIELAESFRKYFPKVDHFHAVSESIVKEARQYGLNPDRASVIRPAVQKSLFSTPLKRSNKKESLSILSVGRFHWKKGYNFALDAMKILKNKNFLFHYTIVAGGEHEEILFQIHSLGLQDHVSIVHGLPHNEVINKMKDSDLFLLPSVEEGIANVVLEAMAIGIPVVTTNCGGMEEVIEDQINGFLVPVRDPDAIVAAVESYKTLSLDKLDKLRENARQTIIQNHTIDNQVKAMKTLYEQVISQSHI
jgi:colanic acid/amylovoran biosynthesis glycosyltransferase